MDVVIDSRDSVSNLDQSRWGTNLDNLLNDSDGVEFFNKFLSYKHSASHLLDFWFACKGFRSNADLSNPDKLFQVAKVIYRTYIKSGASHAVPLPYILKQNINECLSSYHHGYKKGLSSNASVQPPDRCLFDSAQNVVKSLLEQKYYPEFLTFIACPSNLLCITSSRPLCSDRKTRNKYLEFLYSDYKLESRRSNRTKHKSFSEFNRFSADQSPGAKNFHPLFTPDYNLANNNNNNCNIPSTSEQISRNPFVRLTTSWTSSTIQSPVIHSAQPDLHYDKSSKSHYHHHRSTSRHQFLHPLPGSIPKAPATVNDSILTDSHLQQIDNHANDTTRSKRQHDDNNSCDNQSQFTNQPCFMNNNNNSNNNLHPGNGSNQISTQAPITSSSVITMQSVNSTSNNVDLPFMHSVNLRQTHQSDNLIKESNTTNNNDNNPPKINWTIRKQTNLAESDPVSFVQLLTDRLEKVKESRGKLEKLMSLVNHQVDEKYPTESKSTLPIEHTDSYGFISINQHNNPSFHLDHLNWTQLKSNSFINTTNSIMNEINSSTIQQYTLNYPHNTGSELLNSINKSQNAQEILDDHCSRIWADESDGNMDTQLLLSYSKRQQNDYMHTPISNQSLLMTSYPSMLCNDTLVNSMKHNKTDIVCSESNVTEYELKKLTEQSKLATVVVSSTDSSCVSSNNNNNNNNNNRTEISDNSYRRRHITASGGNVIYRSFSRPNKADLRSIASWDSGVVSNYYEKKHRLHHHHDDLDIMDDTVDTASILEAASLQALSSSTTELALVNGEVTAKLVEKIIRHYPRGIFDGNDNYVRKNHTNTSEQSYFKSSQFKETSNLNHAYPFSSSRLRRRSKQCESFYESPSSSLSYPIPGVNLNSTCSANNTTTATTGTCQQHPGIMIPCECHRCIHCTHSPSALNDHLSANYCNCNYIHQLNDKPKHSTTCHSQQLPIITASDTSSTFDSGISSAYDQLPLRKQVNNNRENRSQSLHSWQTNPNFKDKHLSTPRGNRTHSASKSMYENNDNNNNNNNGVTTTYTRECPLSNCLISSCYEFDSKQTTPGQQFGQHTMNDLHLCDSCSSVHHHYHNIRHHYRHSHLLHHHSHCPELMINDLTYKYDVNNDCKKPTSGKLLQHWLQLQQNSSETLRTPLRPTTTNTTQDDDDDEQKIKSLSSDNAVLLSYDNSQAQMSKNGKEPSSSSHGRKSHHHHHHHHSHRRSSAHRTGNNNVNITANSSTNNKNPKHSMNFDNSLESNNNIQLNFDENNDDHDENNTSTRLDSKLSSSSSGMMQQSCHTTSTTGSSGPGLVVGYYLCDDPVPYRTVWTGGSHNPPPSSSISSSGLFVEVNDQSEIVDNFQTKLSNQSLLTLGQFKQLIAKKGVYR
ncbi:unnamed protein product [Schistosoma spindalis]|nr:unnamed protein product [Schistosoma spindale]